MNINIFENSETISKRIKNIRKYYKMNQQDFAKEIGILQSTLSEIERGNVSPQFKTLQLLGDMIGRSNLEWLLDDDIDLASFDIVDMNNRLKNIPRIYEKIYEHGIYPTEQEIELIERDY